MLSWCHLKEKLNVIIREKEPKGALISHWVTGLTALTQTLAFCNLLCRISSLMRRQDLTLHDVAIQFRTETLQAKILLTYLRLSPVRMTKINYSTKYNLAF